VDLAQMSWTDWNRSRSGREALLIDVRSPKEFQLDHARAALSVPLLEDDQRHIVGLLYAEAGEEKAIHEAGRMIRERLEIYRERLPLSLPNNESLKQAFGKIYQLIESNGLTQATTNWSYSAQRWDEDLAQSREPVFVCCWRGGMRSRTFALLLNQLGLRAVQLLDGYKGYRKWVREYLKSHPIPQTIVIHGMTGSGKTELLHRLEKRYPNAVIDLEGLAGHRSSILGDVGLSPASKKGFDTGLVTWFEEHSSGWLIVEGESRKIGKVPIPDRLWGAMKSGVHVHIDCDRSQRAQRLVAEYVRPERRQAIRTRLQFLAPRLSGPAAQRLVPAFDSGDDLEVAMLLLEHYYDPRYQHAQKGIDYVAHFDSTAMDELVDDLSRWLDGHIVSCSSPLRS
jgi:tRNA 2-selenouridine synthase